MNPSDQDMWERFKRIDDPSKVGEQENSLDDHAELADPVDFSALDFE